MTAILGIDPGLRATGLCAIDGTRIVYRGSVKTPREWSDHDARARICSDVSEALKRLQAGLEFVGSVWVESYEYQGPRTHTENAIRISLLVGQLVGSLSPLADVYEVTRSTWGRALGSDRAVLARIERLTGLRPKNAHERDAAAVALYGQRRGALRRTA